MMEEEKKTEQEDTGREAPEGKVLPPDTGSKAGHTETEAEAPAESEKDTDVGPDAEGKGSPAAPGKEDGRTEETYEPPKTKQELMAAIEAILFAMGDAVEIADLAKALAHTKEEITEAAEALAERYDAAHAGIMIQRFDDAYQMSTRGERYKDLIRIAKVPKKVTLSDAVIETLSIIAYRQPITKAEIEQIRGVSSDYAINRLISYDLVKELGRKDAPGRPILFGTTEQFLRSFGVRNLSDLPSLNAVREEEFRSEAEEEVDKRLGV